MRHVREWLMVMVLCCAAAAAAGEEPPDARLQKARTAFAEANMLWETGQYASAIARGEHALALWEAMLGGTHPDVARCLDKLGSRLLLQGESARAEPLLQRALAIREAAFDENHPEVARTLNHLARLYSAQQLYTRAESILQRALSIQEAALGGNHPDVADTLHNLGDLYRVQQVDARARRLYVRALAIREVALGKNHPDVARTLNELADVYLDQKLYARAEPLYQRALAIREAALGKSHPDVADTLNNLAIIYRVQGLYTRARPLYERALVILEAALGNPPPDVAALLNQLANLYLYQGLYTRAEPLSVRALALREAANGEHHPLVAESLFNLANLYLGQGSYARAEPLYVRALAIREAANGKHHPAVATSLSNLARLYSAQGLHARAEPLYVRAIAILEGVYGKHHPNVAYPLENLANLYQTQGLYPRAEPLYVRAIAIHEAAVGKNHPYVSGPLNHLGRLYVTQGLYARAEPLLQRALVIRQTTHGKNTPPVAESLDNLANLYQAQGLYDRARPLYARALAIREATLGRSHPGITGTINNLAVLHLAQRRLAEALPLFTRAFAMSEQRLRQEALGFSEERLARFLQLLRADEERLYALLRAHPDNDNVGRLALGAVLLRKGRSIEEMANISRTIYRSLGAQDRDTFERLGELRTQLAQLSLQGPGATPPKAYRQRLEELSEQSAALEADLARRSAPLRALTTLPSPEEMVDRVAAALPKDGALVEFITYLDRPLVPKPGASEAQTAPEPRYLALVLFPDATLRVRDLGPAEPIDHAASRLRDALANRDAAVQAPAQALYQLAFHPLVPLLADTHRLFLSPDGQLALVPFAALHDGHHFLVDTFDLTYVPSGERLLPRPQESAPPGFVVVLADPDFSPPLQALPERTEDEQRAWAPPPLPGTRQEAEAIQRLLPQAKLFLGSEATKERLLRLPTPGILHLATHGFFQGNEPESPASRAIGHFGALGEDTQASSPPDPLLRSGLMFAGANAPVLSGATPASRSSDSALVTALELAGLDLWGTQLVVLSACDTGRGDINPGQGVYGLRRAFLVAGAETVVMSLWKVNDEATRTLMEAYYRNLVAGQGRATALSEAMRELRVSRPHPHYWAPFIALGSAAPLRAITPTALETPERGTEALD